MGKSTDNLLHKYLHQNLSAEEWQTLLQHIRDNEEDFSSLDKWWQDAPDSIPGLQKQLLFRQLMQSVGTQTNTERGGTRLNRRKRLRRALVWCLPLLLVGTCALYYLMHNNRHSTPSTVADLMPARQASTLTLPDGKQIALNAGAAVVYAENGDSIINMPDGTVRYVANNNTSNSNVVHKIATKAGNTYKLVLADGSKIWLNNASSITFPSRFSANSRQVTLTGEAYFEIAADPKHPFMVSVGEQTVEVLGTHFNINAYHPGERITTTLLQGKIKVYDSRQPQKAVLVKPQQQTVYHANQVQVASVQADTIQAVAWKNGLFSFNRTPVKEALEQIALWYDADIRFESQPPDMLLSGQLHRNLTVSQVLELLIYDGIHCHLEGRTIVITDH